MGLCTDLEGIRRPDADGRPPGGEQDAHARGGARCDGRVCVVMTQDFLVRVRVVDLEAGGKPEGSPLAHADAVSPAPAPDDDERRRSRTRRERERGKDCNQEGNATHQLLDPIGKVNEPRKESMNFR